MTLVEIMVSLLIGMVVVLVASALLVGANGDYLHHSESMRLNDGGRYALDIAGQAVRQAGYVNWDGATAPLLFGAEVGAGVAGLDARSLSRGGDGVEAPLPGAVNGSDVLALRYGGSGAGGNGDGSVLNCAGFGVAGVAAPASPAPPGWSIFYVALGTDGEAELRCKYRSANGWGADAIVRGVDSFQVLYGIDTDTPADGAPNVYVNATALAALDDALALLGANAAERARDKLRKTWWKRVRSIKIGLLLHGDIGSRPQAPLASYELFGRDYSDAHGGDSGVRVNEADLAPALRQRARQQFSTTVFLRNGSG
ncbi:PilW family protein [Rugamonas sp. CCM 8940]|nr:PilW family protein [Rugamonas sp. CCM 8940]